MERSKLTVLVVEDQWLNREILGSILSPVYDVVEADNGAAALELLARTPQVSAILLDLIMPVMDGYTLLERLRNSPYASIPTIVMTGEKDSDTEEKALNLGAWDFVSKPYQPATLMTRLKNVIVRSQYYLLSEMRHAYEHDPLTGLYNRTHFFEETRRLLGANPDIRFALIRFDIDHFQTYNSFWGEEEGDRLLRFIADQLRSVAQQCDPCVYARLNADAFCLCAPYNEDAVRRYADRTFTLLQGYNPEYRLVPSFGIYVIDDPAEPIQKMYEFATLAAKEAKNSYLSQLGYYRPELSDRVLQSQWIVNEMQQALDTRQFEVYLQPKYDLCTEAPCGAEALVRWRHPEKGLLSPGVFIPVLEKNGFIGKIDYYMWEAVCRLLRDWRDRGLQAGPISVNVSRVNMYNPNLVSFLTGLVRRYGVPPAQLQLEVTESAYMDDPLLMEKSVDALQKAGFTILMDDFGSGYSSLNTLKDIHVDVLKIDMKFLSGGSDAQRSRSILASAVRLAGWLGMPVIMEGVETAEQTAFLRSIGCDYAQGYYYARPMPVEDYERLLTGAAQQPAASRAEHLPEIAAALWGARPETELFFNSIDLPAAVCELNLDRLCTLRANIAFTDLFGSDFHLERELPPEALAAVSAAFAQAAESRLPQTCRLAAPGADGSVLQLRMTVKYWGLNATSAVLLAQFFPAGTDAVS